MDNKTPTAGSDAGRQIPPRRQDAGSGQNETRDGSAAINEALRHPSEDTPSGASLASSSFQFSTARIERQKFKLS
jgi:hypothetical protein